LSATASWFEAALETRMRKAEAYVAWGF